MSRERRWGLREWRHYEEGDIIYPTKAEFEEILDVLAMIPNRIVPLEHGPNSAYWNVIENMSYNDLYQNLGEMINDAIMTIKGGRDSIDEMLGDKRKEVEEAIGIRGEDAHIARSTRKKIEELLSRYKESGDLYIGNDRNYLELVRKATMRPTEIDDAIIQLRNDIYGLQGDLRRAKALMKSLEARGLQFGKSYQQAKEIKRQITYDITAREDREEDLVAFRTAIDEERVGYQREADEYKRGYEERLEKIKEDYANVAPIDDRASKFFSSFDEGAEKEKMKTAIDDDIQNRWKDIMKVFASVFRLPPGMREELDELRPEKKTDTVTILKEIFERYFPPETSAVSPLTQAEINERRKKIRGKADDFGKSLYIDPMTMNVDMRIQRKTDDLLIEAEERLGVFYNLTAFDCETPLDFTKGLSAEKFVADRMRLVMPRLGRFQVSMVAKDQYNSYQDYIIKLSDIDEPEKEVMIQALEELVNAIQSNKANIDYINRVHFTEMLDTNIVDFNLCLSRRQFIAEVRITVQQLTEPEPNIDNYSRMLSEIALGSDPSTSTRDIRCRFVNPFRCAPVYLIKGIEGAKHKEINKVFYWLHIKNSACKDLECIPKALEQFSPEVPKVSEEAVKFAMETILKKTGVELADEMTYREVLAKVEHPWIIVSSVTERGEWRVNHASSVELIDLTPMEFKSRMGEIVGLHVRGGHMTRIMGITQYDEAGWKYTTKSFAIIGYIGMKSGLGTCLMKLLRGHAKMLESGVCCVGQRMMDVLMDPENSRKNPLEQLALFTSREMIPNMVKDSLYLYSILDEQGNIRMGSGTIDGREYPGGVPLRKLNVDDCIQAALDEYDSRAGIAKLSWNENYRVSRMLHLPQWMIVTSLQNDDWVVEAASADCLRRMKPIDVLPYLKDIIILVRTGTTFYHMARGLEYLLTVPCPDNSRNIYTARYVFTMFRNTDGIVNAIRQMNRVDPEDGTPLMEEEELRLAEGTPELGMMVRTFKRMRVCVISEVAVSKIGRVKTISSQIKNSTPKRMVELPNGTEVKYGGPIMPEELERGAPDLIRIWKDPNDELWVILNRTYFNMEKLASDVTEKLPNVIICDDYETVYNASGDTIPTIMATSIHKEGEKKEVSIADAIHYIGSQCDGKMVNDQEKLLAGGKVKLTGISFNGSFFDQHYKLRSLSTYGNFGALASDRVTYIGNKLLNISWRRSANYIDMRRFTGKSLADVCEELKVPTKKSKIDLLYVQKCFQESGYNLQLFWNRLNRLPSSVLVQNIGEDSKDPGFIKHIGELTAGEAYIEYCKNDTVAALQVWLKLREAFLHLLDYSNLTEEEKDYYRPDYDINKYCTLPAMGYKIYRRALPWTGGAIGKGVQITPPIASCLEEHEFIKAASIGPRSECPEYGEIGVRVGVEDNFDAYSLFPFSFMNVPMPAGRLKRIARRGETVPAWFTDCEYVDGSPLVPNLHGFYYVTVVSQPPGYCIIPSAKEGKSLNWQNRKRQFSRVVTAISIRQHIEAGGEIIVHYGVYATELFWHYGDKSFWVWKDVKMREDDINEDCKAQVKALKASGVSGEELKEAEERIFSAYHPNTRYGAKALSVSVLGKTGSKLKEFKQEVLFGAAAIEKFQEEHKDDEYYIQYLAEDRSHLKTPREQVMLPYSSGAVGMYVYDKHKLFEDSKGKRSSFMKVPEAVISVTMLGYSHFHMWPAARRMYVSRSLSGQECDGLHCETDKYVDWVEKNLPGVNPFWIDSPLENITRGSAIDDDIFKPCPTEPKTNYIKLLGSFYCGSYARAYAVDHGMPTDMITKPDYGHFKQEYENHSPKRWAYPFAKFYMVVPTVPSGNSEADEPVFRSKGIGKHTKQGEELVRMQIRHRYQRMDVDRRLKTLEKSIKENKTGSKELELALADELMKIKQEILNMERRMSKELAECLEQSPVLLGEGLYERLCKGIGIDAADFRFQGKLAKMNANIMRYFDSDGHSHVSFNSSVGAPIVHSFITKRIEPPARFLLKLKKIRNEKGIWAGERKMFLNGIELEEPDVLSINTLIDRLFHKPETETEYVESMFLRRGFTVATTHGPCYVSNKAIGLITNDFYYRKWKLSQPKRSQKKSS